MNNSRVTLLERIIAAGTYLTMGLVGFVWLIIAAITKIPMKSFIRYHIFQSFFLVMAYFLLTIFVQFIVGILGIIPFINILVYKLLFLFNTPIIFGYSIVSSVVLIITVYLVLTSLQGKFTYIPWVSNIISSNTGR